MNLSLGEFQAIVAKALRGAGYSWGMSAEGAGACRSLAAMGIDASDHVLRLLEAVDAHGVANMLPDATWSTASGSLCPLSVGAALSDAPPTSPLAIARVLEPMLLVPSLATLATSQAGFDLAWPGGSVRVGVNGPDRWAFPPVADVTIESAPAPEVRAVRATRVDVGAESLEQLDRYAYRTYAPSTEASRAGGAGAGLNDND